MNDLIFISGDFLYGDLPQGKEYLSHYFQGEVEKIFLSYFFFSSHVYKKDSFIDFYENFCDHSGRMCSTRWVRKLLNRINRIESDLNEANKVFDFAKIGEIKSGNASF